MISSSSSAVKGNSFSSGPGRHLGLLGLFAYCQGLPETEAEADMSSSWLELAACSLLGKGSGGGDAGSGEGTGATGEVFRGCLFGVDCFLGDLLWAVVPGSGATKVAFSAQRAWVCCLASWMAAAPLGSVVTSSSLSASDLSSGLGKGDTDFGSMPMASRAAFLAVLAASETIL